MTVVKMLLEHDNYIETDHLGRIFYDASTAMYHWTNGSGIGNTPAMGDEWRISIGGKINKEYLHEGTVLRALVDQPGQEPRHWGVITEGLRDISMIVAVGHHNIIGNNGKMPWHIPKDLALFKKLTMGNVLIMGRKTYESLPHNCLSPSRLPGRHIIIISRNKTYEESLTQSAIVAPTVFDALRIAIGYNSRIMIVGGEKIYSQMLVLVNTVYMTAIDKGFSGDTFFPILSSSEWELQEETIINDDPHVDFTYRFQTHTRK